jgi:hypothetical protein
MARRPAKKGALPRKKRKVPAHVRAAADRAAARSAGKDPLAAVPDKPASPLEPPEVARAAAPTTSGKPAHRPPKYKAEFAKQAKKLCSLGATDQDLADFFEVNTTTIWRWRSVHKDFCNALKVGKGAPDDRVERSLYQRAVGYSFQAVKIHCPMGTPVITEYVEHVPPDPGAAKLWLTNRRPEEWREKTEAKHTLDNSGAFLQIVQTISDRARPKQIEGKPVS